MSFYEVVPASVLHVKPLCTNLRPVACSTLRAFGLDARESLRRAFASSNECWTVLWKDKPEAMWGVQGALLSDHVQVWVALSETAVRFPLAIVRKARAEMQRLSEQRILYATVFHGDERARLFARSIGFAPVESDDPDMSLMRYGAAA